MITDVENLYDFGVNIGILPEDHDMQMSLRRMKLRFRSLLRPSSSSQDSSTDGGLDDFEDYSESA